MRDLNDGGLDFGLAVARDLCDASDQEWPKIFQELRQTGRLSEAICQINNLLNHPKYGEIARGALRRIGFDIDW